MFVKVLSLTLFAVCLGSPFYHFYGYQKQPFVCNSEPSHMTAAEEGDIAVRSFLLRHQRQWPFATVPYTIDRRFSPNQVAMIKDNIKKFSDISCVRWVPKGSQRDYVAFIKAPKSNMCSSTVGRKGGMQKLNLGDDCFDEDNGYQGAIAHEMMHAIGFIHEQQRVDRDCYVAVAKSAIVKRKFDYKIVPETSLDFPYDFVSIMHYGTSRSLISNNREKIGNNAGEFTELDKMKLNNMYCKGPTFCEQDPEKCRNFRMASWRCAVKASTKKIVQK